MNRTRTPVKTQKKKHVPECEDVDQEFCKRALSLLTSLYENPTADEILTFPPVKKDNVPPPEKKHNFNSNIVDLRLRRSQEQQISTIQELNSKLSERIDDMAKELKEPNLDLDDVFMVDTVERPEVPRYIANIQNDQKQLAKLGRKKKREPMDMERIQTEYRERLRLSKERGTQRLQKRIDKIINSGPQVSKETYYYSNRVDDLDYRKREKERRETLENRRKKQLTFMKPEDYRKLVKPKKPVQHSEDDENLENEN